MTLSHMLFGSAETRKKQYRIDDGGDVYLCIIAYGKRRLLSEAFGPFGIQAAHFLRPQKFAMFFTSGPTTISRETVCYPLIQPVFPTQFSDIQCVWIRPERTTVARPLNGGGFFV
ncbi:MAG: hypothetical protein AAFW81_04955 [Pseudomonadota bacterium]